MNADEAHRVGELLDWKTSATGEIERNSDCLKQAQRRRRPGNVMHAAWIFSDAFCLHPRDMYEDFAKKKISSEFVSVQDKVKSLIQWKVFFCLRSEPIQKFIHGEKFKSTFA